MTHTAELPPLPVREPGRTIQIAAIQSLGTFLAAHPEYPIPLTVSATALVDTVEEVEAFAERHDVEVYDGEAMRHATAVVSDEGARVTYAVAAYRPGREGTI